MMLYDPYRTYSLFFLLTAQLDKYYQEMIFVVGGAAGLWASNLRVLVLPSLNMVVVVTGM